LGRKDASKIDAGPTRLFNMKNIDLEKYAVSSKTNPIRTHLLIKNKRN